MYDFLFYTIPYDLLPACLGTGIIFALLTIGFRICTETNYKELRLDIIFFKAFFFGAYLTVCFYLGVYLSKFFIR